jgi:hypothetical protein
MRRDLDVVVDEKAAPVAKPATVDKAVITGLSRSKNGVASARLCPGDPRLSSDCEQGVDGRDKPGHDTSTQVIISPRYEDAKRRLEP